MGFSLFSIFIQAFILCFILFVVARQEADLDFHKVALVLALYAAIGLIAEFARERRLFVPIDAIPDRVVDAFIASEDQNFFVHTGVDPRGIVRAAIANIDNVKSSKRLVRTNDVGVPGVLIDGNVVSFRDAIVMGCVRKNRW